MLIRLYHLERCGFFKRGEDEPIFGTLDEWRHNFIEWVRSRPNVMATATFENQASTTRRVFCTTATSDDRGNLGVALWNETPSDEEGVDYITFSGQVGNVEAQSQPLPEESIPGWPTYLWLLPNQNIIAALVPDSTPVRNTGMPQARDYFREYLYWHSQFVVSRRVSSGMTDASYEIEGYRSSDLEEPEPRLTAYFDTRPLYLPRRLDELHDHWSDIRKLIIEANVHMLVPSQKDLLDGFLSWIGTSTENNRAREESAKYRLAVDWQPQSPQELDNMIRGRENREEEDNHSVGVQLKGGSKIHWFGYADGKDSTPISAALNEQRLWGNEALEDAWSQANGKVTELLQQLETHSATS